mmetsp:Transcript_39340/g.104425  ORF Transcript_39340/g.104425 Transcript_39340/m.104425 type:complete len:103 (+) Transcript_39340:412-720(+)
MYRNQQLCPVLYFIHVYLQLARSPQQCRNFSVFVYQQLCPFLSNHDEIEWTTETRPSVVPYGLLVRIFEPGRPPDYFMSPVDGGRFDKYLAPNTTKPPAATV